MGRTIILSVVGVLILGGLRLRVIRVIFGVVFWLEVMVIIGFGRCCCCCCWLSLINFPDIF